ncbi:MAG: helix-turn-helix domain-containing protein, partial [Methanobacteriaceae archaeon]
MKLSLKKEVFRSVTLLLLNNSDLNQKDIAKMLNITPKTVTIIKKKYLNEGL